MSLFFILSLRLFVHIVVRFSWFWPTFRVYFAVVNEFMLVYTYNDSFSMPHSSIIFRTASKIVVIFKAISRETFVPHNTRRFFAVIKSKTDGHCHRLAAIRNPKIFVSLAWSFIVDGDTTFQAQPPSICAYLISRHGLPFGIFLLRKVLFVSLLNYSESCA